MLRQMTILACLILVAGTANAKISADVAPIDPTNCIYLELTRPKCSRICNFWRAGPS